MPTHFFDGLGEQVLEIFMDAEMASYRPQSGSPQPIEIIFNDRHQEVDLDGKLFGAPKPRAWYRTGTLCPKYGEQLVINGRVYIIREVKDDGLELTELTLSESV